MRSFGLSAVGHDQPGIVAAMTEVLLRHGGNVEDSQMTILRGHFTMTLVVSLPDDVEVDAVRAELGAVGERLGIEALLLSEIEALDPDGEAVPSHMVTVYGPDHPGIVHAMTSALAQRNVDITDLNARLVGDEGEPVYALMMEIALPQHVGLRELERELERVAGVQGVDVTVRDLGPDDPF